MASEKCLACFGNSICKYIKGALASARREFIMNSKENVSESFKVPERYLKEGLTPFNLSMALVAASNFKDAFDMLIAREDVYRKTLETDKIAIGLIAKKAKKMEEVEAQDNGFFSLYLSSKEEDEEAGKIIYNVQKELRKGTHKEEQILIKQGVADNMKLLAEVCIPELCKLLKEHVRDLPVSVVCEWLTILNFLLKDNIVLNTWAKSIEDLEKGHTHKDVFQAVSDDVTKYEKEVKSGAGIFFDMLCSKAMVVYPERARDIENEVYNTDKELSQMLLGLRTQVREDILAGKVAIYDPKYNFETITEAIKYIMGKLLWCYLYSVRLIRENINTIDFTYCFELNKRIIDNVNACYKMLDIFDVNRDAKDDKGIVTNMLTGFEYVEM